MSEGQKKKVIPFSRHLGRVAHPVLRKGFRPQTDDSLGKDLRVEREHGWHVPKKRSDSSR